jgi:hypothetical protein
LRQDPRRRDEPDSSALSGLFAQALHDGPEKKEHSPHGQTHPETFGTGFKDAPDETAVSEQDRFPYRLNDPVNHSEEQPDQDEIETIREVRPCVIHVTTFFFNFQAVIADPRFRRTPGKTGWCASISAADEGSPDSDKVRTVMTTVSEDDWTRGFMRTESNPLSP